MDLDRSAKGLFEMLFARSQWVDVCWRMEIFFRTSMGAHDVLEESTDTSKRSLRDLKMHT
jgi:hypothetical protein